MEKVFPGDERARRLKVRERMQIKRPNVRRHRRRSRQHSRCARRGLFRGRRRLGSERAARLLQNVTAKDGTDGKTSTVVEYNRPLGSIVDWAQHLRRNHKEIDRPTYEHGLGDVCGHRPA
ncbi:MAG: hypothetical protein M3O50_04325 [Myxococcota bacterium]|nr:hypothetical protein [Myxococcota bacterium]